MTEINFTSTYRIPITQAGINSAKKAKLKDLIESYPNGLIGNSKVGNARVSIPNSEDANFVKRLKTIGYKVFQKFEGEDIPKENIDVFIKEKLDVRDYNQLGKNKKRMSTEMKNQRRYERRLTEPAKTKQDPQIEETLTQTPQPQIIKQPAEPAKTAPLPEVKPVKTPVEAKAEPAVVKLNYREKIMNGEDYLRIKNQYGEEFANAVFFGIKK